MLSVNGGTNFVDYAYGPIQSGSARLKLAAGFTLHLRRRAID
jgi:hypothetical protein